MRLVRILTVLVFVASITLMLADSAFAQCALCRGSISGNSSLARNLNIGILVLLVPPVSIFCTIFAIAYRNRKH